MRFSTPSLTLTLSLTAAAGPIPPSCTSGFYSASPGSIGITNGTSVSSSALEVSLKIEGTPTMGESIRMCVTVTNNTGSSRVLKEYLNAQVKEYNSHTKEAFWKTEREVHIEPHESKEVSSSPNTNTAPDWFDWFCTLSLLIYPICSCDAPAHHRCFSVWVGCGRRLRRLCEGRSGDGRRENWGKSPGYTGVQHNLTTDRYRGTTASTLPDYYMLTAPMRYPYCTLARI